MNDRCDPPQLLARDHTTITMIWHAALPEEARSPRFILQQSESNTSADRTWSDWKDWGTPTEQKVAHICDLQSTPYYIYRVRCKYTNARDEEIVSNWSESSEAIRVIDKDIVIHPAPECTPKSDNILVHSAGKVQLKFYRPNAEDMQNYQGYMLRFRRKDYEGWKAFDEIDPYRIYDLKEAADDKTKSQMSKSKLEVHKTYYFSYLLVPRFNGKAVWSQPCSFQIPGNYYKKIRDLFPSELLTKKYHDIRINNNHTLETKSTTEILTNKVVFLYFSSLGHSISNAFTKKLAEIWKEYKKPKGTDSNENKHHYSNKFEIVYISCDGNSDNFDKYYAEHHPWHAVQYNSVQRTNLMKKYNIRDSRDIPCCVAISHDHNKSDVNIIVQNDESREFDVDKKTIETIIREARIP